MKDNLEAIMKHVQLHPLDDGNVKSDKAKEYLKLVRLQNQVEAEKEQQFSQLSLDEKEMVFDILQNWYGIPEFLKVAEASEIIGVPPQVVREYIKENRFTTKASMLSAVKIKTIELMEYPGWDKYIEKLNRENRKSKSVFKLLDEHLNEIL